MNKERKEHQSPLGIAIDLGTTYINICLCEISTGNELWKSVRQNPQSDVSVDIIQRLVTARDSKEQAIWLQHSIIKVMAEEIHGAAKETNYFLKDVEHVAIVGNTAMLSLLSGKNYSLLLDPKNWMKSISCIPDTTLNWKKSWNIPENACISVIQPLGGFVGSDLLAGLIHTKISSNSKPSLFIDFGTNSEIALWDGNRFWITSAAGGPAFEGTCISSGMAAVEGAIYRIEKSPEKDDLWHPYVIGDKKPQGICGSAMVDMIAHLLKDGKLRENGRFKNTDENNTKLNGIPFNMNNKDIDAIQRAKAAIAAGWETLFEKSSIELCQLDSIYIGGAFGEYLNPERAIEIGLLPMIDSKKVNTCGNTALNGCKEFLLSNDTKNEYEALRKSSTLLNLASTDTFEERFFQHLFLKPVS